MLMSVTFAVASKLNIKDLLELCNHSLFLNGNGTRFKWTSSPVFRDHRRVMMRSLSSSTDSPKLPTFCQSRRRSLLVSWQTCISRIVSLHGIPLEISSDRGSIFTSKFWDSF